jgi:hypothetical protein
MADNADEATTPKSPGAEAPAKKKGKAKAAKKSARERKPTRNYPSVPLEKALRVAYQIKEKNGGNPWSPDQVATALGVGGKGPDFYYVTAAARDYGLTTGTRDTKEIALTDLGREIVYAGNPQIEHAKKLEAFHNVKLFKKVG